LDASSPLPELNPRVWAEHAALCAAFRVSEEEREVVVGPAAVGAWRAAPGEPFTLAGLDCVSEPHLPWSVGTLLDAAPGVLREIQRVDGPDDRLVTDTFATTRMRDEERRNTISVSPRAMIPSTFWRKNSACSGVALKSPSCLPTMSSGRVP
jgi:hypothetical protein